MWLAQENLDVDDISEEIKMLDENLANGKIDEKFYKHMKNSLITMQNQQIQEVLINLPDEERNAYLTKILDEERSLAADPMEVMIAIPSHERISGKVNIKNATLKILQAHNFPMSQVHVFVAESQHDQYIHLEKDYGLTVVIGGDGILAQRNAIIQYFPEGARIVEMDDDIEDIKNLGVDPAVSVECLVSLFAQSFEKLNKYGGVGLWGLNSTLNRWMTKPEDLTDKIGLYQIVNSVLGYINDKRVKLTTPVMEDFERVCIFHELHLPIVKQNQFGIKTKYWFNEGGIQATMDFEERKRLQTECAQLLATKYPHLCSPKKEKSKQKEGMVGIKFKHTKSHKYAGSDDDAEVDDAVYVEDADDEEEAAGGTKRLPKDIPRDKMFLDGPITYENVFDALESIKLPMQERKNISEKLVQGCTLGVTNARSEHGYVVGARTLERPGLTDLLARLIKQHKPDFEYTSIQVNKDVPCNIHTDANNLGPSYIVGFGDYEPGEDNRFPEKPFHADGGGVWIQDQGAVDCKEKWCLFDGNIPHGTMTPYKGTRYTLVYYKTGNYQKLGEVVQAKMDSGFYDERAEAGLKTRFCEGGSPEKCGWIQDRFNFPSMKNVEPKKQYDLAVNKRLEFGIKEFGRFMGTYVLAVTFENENQKEIIKINVDAEEYDEYRDECSEEELSDWIEEKCYAGATLDWSREDIDMDWEVVS